MATNTHWERQPRESARAFEAFQKYRDMGPSRSVVKVGQECRKSESLLSRWSVKYRWVDRVQAYDAYMDSQQLEKQRQARLDMAVRHAQMARALQGKALERLKTLTPAELNVPDLLRYVVEASKLERLAMGEPTEKTAVETTSLARQIDAYTHALRGTVAEAWNGEGEAAVTDE